MARLRKRFFCALLRKIAPARPAKPVDTIKKEGLAALLCILLYVSGLFGFPNIVSLSFLGHIMDFWDSFLMLLRFSGEGAE